MCDGVLAGGHESKTPEELIKATTRCVHTHMCVCARYMNVYQCVLGNPFIAQMPHTLPVCTAHCLTFDFETVKSCTHSSLIPFSSFLFYCIVLVIYLQHEGILVHPSFTSIKLTCDHCVCLTAGIKWRMWPELVQGWAEWQGRLHPQELHRNESTPVSTAHTAAPTPSRHHRCYMFTPRITSWA